MPRIPYIEDFSAWEKDFSFYIPISVRFSETDMYGHVNNVSPFIYFEEARIAYLNSIGFLSKDMRQKDGIIVADLQCNYLKELYFGDDIRVYVKTASVGNTSFDIHYKVMREEEAILTARGRLVYIDTEKKAPKKLSDALKQKLLET
ncbi:4-hydroxybenzoyl-CoA thioesterase [Oceanobacillus oncorhynchi subsp. incaldanensis]|uniref:1,4-dihydroxy-2-naphthoyl-CoA hydrolase n=2 Tax=Oceanobacillus TaxID=182709 RepID=A0A0A1MEX6_9BACI|nr:thioesterase family protein [Oceanobacillus oncorhynchi]MDM8100494.1 thioesterase family protein [Oceanobacillus oncorhynchi]UUI38261.1 acyl-CoA thioesterase [Oceanobacillus oncorhynchi]GIO17016.1 4-hydroxybenzoyl-CoA thioesterase [Oceanobacillus oncorhynchi subsp. incaldanensis]CEI83930.1 1,4-dihydroxy-2-naphthoyl-CoA hydrolase [Oceanobacillus oncorhynchi]